MSHMSKWIAEFLIKDLNECADRKQEQRAIRAERYKARTDREAAIAEKHTDEERFARTTEIERKRERGKRERELAMCLR